MRIGILTHYQVESHGAVLQHYALTEYLRKMGHDVYTLSYRKSLDFANHNDQKKFAVGLRSIPFYVKEYLLKRGPSFILTMAKKHMLLTRFNKRHFAFQNYANCDVDLAIVGSDEVWSIQLGANPMMYGHGVSARKLISYAPSFGQTKVIQLEERRCRALVSSGIQGFDALSVRDPGSAEVVNNLIGTQPKLVCDPVLLYGFTEELAKYQKPTNQKYVVVYGYNSNMNEEDRIAAIRQYAKSNNAQVYSLGAYHGWCDKQVSCDPIEFLYWIKGAEAVFTDTFHGTIGAFLCHTPMAVYVRSTNNVKLDHLLTVLGLEERKVKSDNCIEQILAVQLNFDELERKLNPFRKASEEWLRERLKEMA
nr:polysaccharide pyruvyl transferase family protein [Clostridia bacterium]